MLRSLESSGFKITAQVPSQHGCNDVATALDSDIRRMAHFVWYAASGKKLFYVALTAESHSIAQEESSRKVKKHDRVVVRERCQSHRH